MTRSHLIRLLVVACAGVAVGCGDKDDHDGHDHAAPAGGHGEDATDPFAALGAADGKLAKAQKTCPVSDEELGSMGTPVKVMVGDTPVFICCESCRKKLLRDPDKYLKKLGR